MADLNPVDAAANAMRDEAWKVMPWSDRLTSWEDVSQGGKNVWRHRAMRVIDAYTNALKGQDV